MNTVFDYLYTRRPALNYVSPAICQVDFSSSGGPIIVLTPFTRQLGPTGAVWGSLGGGRFRFSWNRYPGALCYSIYKLVDELDPFGPYRLIAECINDNFYDTDIPGCYAVTAITPEGETPLSDQECTPPVPPEFPPTVETDAPTFVSDSSAQLNGLSNPNGLDTSVEFEWGLTTAYGNLTVSQGIGSGVSDVPFSSGLGGLSPATTYHYRALAANADGSAVGDDMEFTTSGGGGGGVTIEAMDFDTMYDISDTGIVSGTLTSLLSGYFFNGVTTTLPTPFGGTSGYAPACTDSGVFVYDDNDGSDHWIWFDGVTLKNILLFSGGARIRNMSADGHALFQGGIYDPVSEIFTQFNVSIGGNPAFSFGLNDSLVVGFNQSGGGQKVWQWVAGAATDITPPDLVTTKILSDITRQAVNANGHMAFQYFIDFSVTTRSAYFNGVSSANIGVPDGSTTSVSVLGLNDSNVVFGLADVLGVLRSFTWTSGGGFVLIPAPIGAAFYAARSINNDGYVVGDSNLGGWVYNPNTGTTVLLWSLLPPAAQASWDSLDAAELINSNPAKQIAGFGTLLGVSNTAYFMELGI